MEPNGHLVYSLVQRIVIVTKGQFVKCGEACGVHPVLKFFPLWNIRHVCRIVSVGVPLVPIRRRHDFRVVVLCLFEPVRVGFPRNTLCGKFVIIGSSAHSLPSVSISIIKHTISNQATRVNLLSITNRQRFTVLTHRVLNGIHRSFLAFDLLLTKRLCVPTMVLVKVVQAVEEINRSLHIIRYLKLDSAHISLIFKLLRLVGIEFPLWHVLNILGFRLEIEFEKLVRHLGPVFGAS